MATGTAANALALAALTPPWGIVYCHEDAHTAIDECGAPEFFAGGAKLVSLPAASAARSRRRRSRRDSTERGFVHHAQPAAISLSQSTEAGSVYTGAEIAALGEFARRQGLALHMDGARFANAVAALGCAPADITWRAGVDALSFGATKNGALAAEAVIFFDPAQGRGFRLSPQARRPSPVEDALPLGAARGLSRGRSVAQERAPRERAWRRGSATGSRP